MNSWIDAVPALCVTVLVLFVPGGAVVTVLGARRTTALALAAPVSFGIAGTTAVVLRPLGLGFTPASFAAATVIAVAAAVAIRLWLFRPFFRLGTLSGSGRADSPAPARALGIVAILAGMAVPAFIIGFRYMRGMASPDRISQSFDDIFHLNAVKFITATQDGSSLALGNLTEASRAFYPAAFHDVAALVSMGTGVGPAVSLATVSIVMAALVWPISCIFLAVRLFGNRPAAILLTGVLSAGFAAFPYHLVYYGVLFPFHAAMAMMPVLLGLTIEVLGQSRSQKSSSLAAAAALVVVLPGIALTHPSVIVATLVLGLPFALAAGITAIRHRAQSSTTVFAWAIGLPIAYVLATIVMVAKARPPLDDAPWFAFESYTSSIGAVLTASPLGMPTAWGMFALTALGLVVGVRNLRRYWPLLALFAIAGGLYIVGASFPDGPLRDTLVGVWYRDSNRLAALLVVAGLPLAVLGAMAIVRIARTGTLRVLRNREGVRPFSDANVLVACALVLAVVLVPLTQRGQVKVEEDHIHSIYAAGRDAPLLSDDERTLIERLDEYVPADDVIVGNPATGTSLAFALGDRRVLIPHVFGNRSADETYLLNHWDEAATDPAVCPLIRAHGAFWALDFGVTWPHGDRSVMPGTDALRTAPGIVEVARVGDAALYRVAVCGDVQP